MGSVHLNIICTFVYQAFIHGDLHVGSVMVNKGNTYVIDPEFATYGTSLAYTLDAFFFPFSCLSDGANLYH